MSKVISIFTRRQVHPDRQPLLDEQGFAHRFFQAYMVAALWSSNDESTPDGGVPMDSNYTIDNIADESFEQMKSECCEFIFKNRRLLKDLNPESAGHDFWLTRCGHGAGFWDRGLGEVGEELTKACRQAGNRDLYIGDDNQIWQG